MREFILVDKKYVYKKTLKHWLKVSPFKAGEDRRLLKEDVSKHKVKPLKTSVAYGIINNQYKAFTYEWEHNGEHYKVDKTFENPLSERNMVPIHHFDNKMFQIIWRKGTLYWRSLSCLYNDELFEFKDINKVPEKYIGFFDTKTFKPVYKLINDNWEII